MKDWFMNIDEVQLITFSPTCTSKQVGEAIVHGTGISSVSKVDLTLEAAGKREVPSHALAVITAPLQAGRQLRALRHERPEEGKRLPDRPQVLPSAQRTAMGALLRR